MIDDKPIIRVFNTGEPRHPYPWRFEIKYRGVTHSYGGIPNQCETKRAATARVAWRAKWLREGTHNKRYVTMGVPQ
jgi:hypothetical protein